MGLRRHLRIQIIGFIIIFFSVLEIHAQLSVSGVPESFQINTKSTKIIPEKQLVAIDTAQLIAADKAYNIENRYAVMSAVDIDMKRDGVKTEITGRGYIWQYRLNASQSYSLGIHFTKYQLPQGATVYIYNDQHQQIEGAFTKLNNNDQNELMIADFQGQQVIIEYFEPYIVEFPGLLAVEKVSQAYRNILKSTVSATTTTARVGINCTQGANWQDAKHAVCRMTFNDGAYGYYCTGFLINNVRVDGTPYFQTANHCINTAAEASSLVTYYNYENSTCSDSDASASLTLSGATIKATSKYTDFTLLLLNEIPPLSYNPFFAGWDASTRTPLNGTGIHHPAGTPKCISLGYNPPTNYAGSISWTDDTGKTISTTTPYTHWLQIFDVGQTEGGSSGSPLFDDNQRVVGQLHGGSTTENYYGKFNLSWNYNSSSAQQLKYWLDPDITGKLTMDGTYLNIAPKASFTEDYNHVCLSDNIVITDNSKYYPTQWNWKISPDTYHFVSGTSSTTRNIIVGFEKEGYYAVTLESTNQYGSNIYTDTIHAENINLTFKNLSTDSVVCGCNVIKYPLSISGANTYTFNIAKSQKFTYTSDDSNLYLSLKQAEHVNGSFDTWITTTGTLGSCIAKDSLLLKVRMPVNDDVVNALPLVPGQNGAYSNFCASPESNEPYPALTGCYVTNSWCPDATTSVLKHTIWFTFRAPSFGKTNINTRGANNRIAVYQADSTYNILKTGTLKAQLIGANEGRSAADGASFLEDLDLQAGKIYWLQVDGSNNETGSCMIDFLSNSIEVYPNPSSGIFNVTIANNEDGVAEINAYTIQGSLVFNNLLTVTKEINQFTLDLSVFPTGIYILNVKLNGSNLRTKLMVVK